jgi:hypothetical protein
MKHKKLSIRWRRITPRLHGRRYRVCIYRITFSNASCFLALQMVMCELMVMRRFGNVKVLKHWYILKKEKGFAFLLNKKKVLEVLQKNIVLSNTIAYVEY